MSKPVNISASRGAAILGLSKWKTPASVWLEIQEQRHPGFCEQNHYEFPVVDDNPSMRWGRAFESAIIELAGRAQNNAVARREEFFERDYITCHIDGMYCEDFGVMLNNPETKPVLHEGKTTNSYSFHDEWGEPGTDRVPQEYQIQCQHQMLCTGAEKVILSVLVFPRRVEEFEEIGWEIIEYHEGYKLENKITLPDHWQVDPYAWARTLDQLGYFHQYHIPTHPELQRLVLEKYTAWWEKYVIGKTEPEPETYDDIRALVRNPVGTIISDETIERLVAERNNIKDEISGSGPLAKRAEQIKVNLLKYMKDAGAVIDDDTTDRWILRDRQGRKLATYGKNKAGIFRFR